MDADRNPFLAPEREHFPSLDDMFATLPFKSSKMRPSSRCSDASHDDTEETAGHRTHSSSDNGYESEDEDDDLLDIDTLACLRARRFSLPTNDDAAMYHPHTPPHPADRALAHAQAVECDRWWRAYAESSPSAGTAASVIIDCLSLSPARPSLMTRESVRRSPEPARAHAHENGEDVAASEQPAFPVPRTPALRSAGEPAHPTASPSPLPMHTPARCTDLWAASPMLSPFSSLPQHLAFGLEASREHASTCMHATPATEKHTRLHAHANSTGIAFGTRTKSRLQQALETPAPALHGMTSPPLSEIRPMVAARRDMTPGAMLHSAARQRQHAGCTSRAPLEWEGRSSPTNASPTSEKARPINMSKDADNAAEDDELHMHRVAKNLSDELELFSALTSTPRRGTDTLSPLKPLSSPAWASPAHERVARRMPDHTSCGLLSATLRQSQVLHDSSASRRLTSREAISGLPAMLPSSPTSPTGRERPCLNAVAAALRECRLEVGVRDGETTWRYTQWATSQLDRDATAIMSPHLGYANGTHVDVTDMSRGPACSARDLLLGSPASSLDSCSTRTTAGIVLDRSFRENVCAQERGGAKLADAARVENDFAVHLHV